MKDLEETVLLGASHPGTPLQVLNTSAGYFLGYVDQDGAPYSRDESTLGPVPTLVNVTAEPQATRPAFD